MNPILRNRHFDIANRSEGSAEHVAVGGVRLFVLRFGDPALPMLITVHGGPTWDHSYLLPAVAQLSDIAHVVIFDLRGCGRSSRTPPVGDLPIGALQPDLVADDLPHSSGTMAPGVQTCSASHMAAV
jgi:pimeloyl-ACP methyl ester carboxylesterase